MMASLNPYSDSTDEETKDQRGEIFQSLCSGSWKGWAKGTGSRHPVYYHFLGSHQKYVP